NAWHGVHTACQAWTNALKNAMRNRYPGNNPLKDRFFLIVGLNAAARVIAKEVARHGGNAILASNDKKAGQALAQSIGCRSIAFDALYTTIHDVLIVCDTENAVHVGYLKPGMFIMDLTAGARLSPLLRGARERGCDIVAPLELLLDLLELQARTLTGKPVSRDVLRAAIPERFLEEE